MLGGLHPGDRVVLFLVILGVCSTTSGPSEELLEVILLGCLEPQVGVPDEEREARVNQAAADEGWCCMGMVRGNG